jgi:hypothetical protein
LGSEDINPGSKEDGYRVWNSIRMDAGMWNYDRDSRLSQSTGNKIDGTHEEESEI